MLCVHHLMDTQGGVYGITVAETGAVASASIDNDIRLWAAADKVAEGDACVAVMTGHEDSVQSVAFCRYDKSILIRYVVCS